MIARFTILTFAWLATAFAAPPIWRVQALALVGAVGAFALRAGWRDDLRTLGRGRDWMLGIGVGAVMAIATGPAYRLAAAHVPGLAPEVARLYGQVPLQGRPLLLVPFFAVVVFEELIWRGAAFRLGLGTGTWVPALLATVLYAFAQGALLSPVVVAVALVCGCAWSALRLATGGLAASIGCHATWDLAVFVLFPLVP